MYLSTYVCSNNLKTKKNMFVLHNTYAINRVPKVMLFVILVGCKISLSHTLSKISFFICGVGMQMSFISKTTVGGNESTFAVQGDARGVQSNTNMCDTNIDIAIILRFLIPALSFK